VAYFDDFALSIDVDARARGGVRVGVAGYAPLMSRGTLLLGMLTIAAVIALAWLFEAMGLARPFSIWAAGLLWIVAGTFVSVALDRRRREGSSKQPASMDRPHLPPK
jgi:MFS superfamily sulfate permease-like transporter